MLSNKIRPRLRLKVPRFKIDNEYRWINRWIDRYIDVQKERWINRQIVEQIYGWIERYMDRK